MTRHRRPEQLVPVHVESYVGFENLPTTIRTRNGLGQVDYADAFAATAPRASRRSPEDWVRALLEETPTGRSAPQLWRMLGLRLGPARRTGYVQGWVVDDQGTEWTRLGSRSSYMTARAVLEVVADVVTVALFLRFDSPVARLIWPPVGVLHRRAVPMMVQQAVRVWRATESDPFTQ